jgi:L-aminopeptidase/D-esterase-like protein
MLKFKSALENDAPLAIDPALVASVSAGKHGSGAGETVIMLKSGSGFVNVFVSDPYEDVLAAVEKSNKPKAAKKPRATEGAS